MIFQNIPIGDNAVASLTEDAVLKIEGIGQLYEEYTETFKKNEEGYQFPWQGKWREIIKEVHISGEIKNIPRCAFADCYFLERVELCDSINHIESNAFAGCVHLKEVIFPADIMSIGNNAFSDCYSLGGTIVLNNIKTIGIKAFDSCLMLEGVYIYSDNIPVIQRAAFCRCIGLKNVSLSNGITVIEQDAFSHCYTLEHISLPESLEEIHANVFYNCFCLKKIILPAGLTELKQDVFKNCINLRQVEFHREISSEEKDVFRNCIALKEIQTPTVREVFENNDSRTKQFPDSLCKEITEDVFDICEFTVTNMVFLKWLEERSVPALGFECLALQAHNLTRQWLKDYLKFKPTEMLMMNGGCEKLHDMTYELNKCNIKKLNVIISEMYSYYRGCTLDDDFHILPYQSLSHLLFTVLHYSE